MANDARLKIIIDALNQGKSELGGVAQDILKAGNSATEASAAHNKLGLAQFNQQQAAMKLAEAEHALQSAEGKGDGVLEALTGEVLRAKVALDQETESVKKAEAATTDLSKNLSNVEGATKNGASGFNVLKGSLTEIQSGIGLAKEAWATYQIVQDATLGETVRFAGEVRELSRTIGASAEQASMLIQAADDVGISAQSVQGSLEAAIKKGVSPTIEGIGKLADEYNLIQDPIAKTDFLFNKFGRSGADLAPLMKLGARGIREAGEAARETGQVLSQEAVDAARKYEVATDDLSDSVEGLKIKLGTALLPAVTATIDRQSDSITTLRLLQQGYATGRLSAGDYTTALVEMYKTGMTGAVTGANLASTIENLKEKMTVATVATGDYADKWERASSTMAQSILSEAQATAQMNDAADLYAEKHQMMADSTATSRQAIQDTITAYSMLSISMAGPVSKENDAYSSKQTELAAKAAKLKAELDKLEGSQGAVAKSEAKNVMSANDLALAHAKVTQATEDLNTATRKISTTKGQASETDAEFAVRVAQLRSEIEGQTDKLGKANQSVTSYVDNSKKIAEVKKAYDEANVAIEQNAQAHDDAAKRIMFDLLQQRAAVGGLTSDEMKALNDVALKWGLVDQSTHDAVVGIDTALAGLATGTSVDAFISQIDGIAAAANNANTAFQALMLQQAGLHGGPGTTAPSSTPAASPAYALSSAPIHQAGGGDWMVNRPTVFVAGDDGPERATFTPLRGGNNTHYQYNTTNRAGDTYIIDDRHTGALLLEMQRRERRAAVEQSMG
jgi:hypothetical protein